MSETTPSTRDDTVYLYDFRRPTALAREHSRVLELAFETFARQWGTQLTANVRVFSQVECDRVSVHTYDEYAASLPSTTAMVLCQIGDIIPKGVIQFPTGAALSWVNSMLGGTREVGETDRTFTPLEAALVRKIMDDAIEDLRYSMGPLLPESITVDGIQYNSQFAQAAATSELMIVAAFSIRIGDVNTKATLALPATVILPKLGEANPTLPAGDAPALLTVQLAQTPVDVSARFTPVPVRPGVILRLQVGDVLPIPHPVHRPLDIAVGDHVVGAAAIGASGSRLAVSVINPEDQK
ncbi:flagellar motor switch protein FliM [Curtobacterium sp. MCBD17_040]|uniref:flagellar motor switch protein FliM n=1 Tax=Curtobacterium sp. MCBD17_040 TaxID=2175674 RepID=UPI000DA703B2|nr:flagellar motor switch protein FliM [Curtobacterium sp. MCBD17_040]WIB65587.1 flagellar motor switch protein FliM [Curtobacterium sp. MCBD17_040]